MRIRNPRVPDQAQAMNMDHVNYSPPFAAIPLSEQQQRAFSGNTALLSLGFWRASGTHLLSGQKLLNYARGPGFCDAPTPDCCGFESRNRGETGLTANCGY